MNTFPAQLRALLAGLRSGQIFRVEWWLQILSSSMLRTRLFLNLLPFVVILLAIGVYAIVLFSRLATSVDATVTKNYESINAVQEMSEDLRQMALAVQNAAVTRNFDSNAFTQWQNRFEANLAVQLRTNALPGESELNEQLKTNYSAFCQGVAAPPTFRTPRDQQAAFAPAVGSSVAAMNRLLEEIRQLNYRAIQATSQNIRNITRNVTVLMLIGVFLALIVSAYACYQLSCSILEPIQLLTEATHEVGEGNLDRPVPVFSRDELGELALSFNKMAAQLQEYRQSTTEEIVRLHRTMETTLASFPDPIFVLSNEGRIELRNPAAVELAARLRLDNELPARLQDLTRKTLESGENFLPHGFNEVVSFRIEGTEKFFLPRILAMRNKDNTRFGAAVVLYDVTRFRLLDAVKTNLVATVSHELKSPLTSVRMVLHILLERTLGALTPKQNELLLAAKDDAERVLRILNDLLDLARLEEGAAALNKEQVHPGELLHGVMGEVNDKVLAQGLRISCVVAPDLPPVAVDRQRINLVFSNLVSNAIKHSPPGGEVVLRAAPAEENRVEFSVTDHGPGIPKEYHTRIFDRFFRVPGQTRAGAGLGLSIAKEITVAHGGRIGVKSAPDQGSTFFVVLNGGLTLRM